MMWGNLGPNASRSERKDIAVSQPELAERIKLMDDAELSALWEQAQYGLRGEMSYREWLRRAGYSDIRSARNAYARYQGIARFLLREFGATCAILSDLTMRERRRRQRRRFGTVRKF